MSKVHLNEKITVCILLFHIKEKKMNDKKGVRYISNDTFLYNKWKV